MQQDQNITDSATVDGLLREGRSILRRGELEIDAREAASLLAFVLGTSEVQVRAFGERSVDADSASRYLGLVRRRAAGEPAAYLAGRREFYGREFLVDPRVLVPRPETEHLVEAVLSLMTELELSERPRILDVGTGSGCIAITLALEMSARVVASDLSTEALDVARTNARRLGARVDFLRADLASPLRLDAFDVVASNPPYVARRELPKLSREVTEHEPHLALFAPDEGTAILQLLLEGAEAMRSGALLVLEIGHDQGDWIARRAESLDHLELVRLIRDYGDRPRTALLRIQ